MANSPRQLRAYYEADAEPKYCTAGITYGLGQYSSLWRRENDVDSHNTAKYQNMPQIDQDYLRAIELDDERDERAQKRSKRG